MKNFGCYIEINILNVSFILEKEKIPVNEATHVINKS